MPCTAGDLHASVGVQIPSQMWLSSSAEQMLIMCTFVRVGSFIFSKQLERAMKNLKN